MSAETAGSISVLATQICLQFQTLYPLFGSGRHQSLTQAEVQNAYERFLLWAGNIGALQDGAKRTSMEHRLREAPDIRNETCTLLAELLEGLNDLTQIAREPENNRISGVSVEEEDEELEDNQKDQDTSADEIEELYKLALDCISGLLRLSKLIKKATPRDRFQIALQRSKTQFPDQFDIAHVGEKFPKLNRDDLFWLKTRLGRTITQRRHYLAYCRDHHEQLSRIDCEHSVSPVVDATGARIPLIGRDEHPGTEKDDAISTIRPHTVIASTKASTLQVAALPMHRELDGVDDALSYTTIGSDVLDHDDKVLQIPSLSVVKGDQETFECPCCRDLQNFCKERTWKRHVFADLRAYVCCFGQGECDLAIFGDRKAWFAHVLEHHLHQWRCVLCERDNFYHEDDFYKHLRTKHRSLPRNKDLDLLRSCQEPLKSIPASSCPFCDKWDNELRKSQPEVPDSHVLLVDWKRFRRHVGSHLEQLALFAIRWFYSDLDNDEQSNAAIEDESHRSSLSSLGTFQNSRSQSTEVVPSLEEFDVHDHTPKTLTSASIPIWLGGQQRRVSKSPPTGRRDTSFCHECQAEWYRDEHGLTCPGCGSVFTEILSESSSEVTVDMKIVESGKATEDIDNQSRLFKQYVAQLGVIPQWQDLERDARKSTASANVLATRRTGGSASIQYQDGAYCDVYGHVMVNGMKQRVSTPEADAFENVPGLGLEEGNDAKDLLEGETKLTGLELGSGLESELTIASVSPLLPYISVDLEKTYTRDKRTPKEAVHGDTSGLSKPALPTGNRSTQELDPKFLRPEIQTTYELNFEGDEYISCQFDEMGERKIAPNGGLQDQRAYNCRTFRVLGRGEKLFMMVIQCARVLGRNSYFLFKENPTLYAIRTSIAEKDDLISKGILPYSDRSRQIEIVTARSMFRHFGSFLVQNGRRVRDDYWETHARRIGFTEQDLPGTQPSSKHLPTLVAPPAQKLPALQDPPSLNLEQILPPFRHLHDLAETALSEQKTRSKSSSHQPLIWSTNYSPTLVEQQLSVGSSQTPNSTFPPLSATLPSSANGEFPTEDPFLRSEQHLPLFSSRRPPQVSNGLDSNKLHSATSMTAEPLITKGNRLLHVEIQGTKPLTNDMPMLDSQTWTTPVQSDGEDLASEKKSGAVRNSKPRVSRYWNLKEQEDFRSNVAYFGTDWASISNNMGTKTPIMVKNHYQRLINGGDPKIWRAARDADHTRERGEPQGPPPAPTATLKRRQGSKTALPTTPPELRGIQREGDPLLYPGVPDNPYQPQMVSMDSVSGPVVLEHGQQQRHGFMNPSSVQNMQGTSTIPHITSEELIQQRKSRKEYLDNYWQRPHEPAAESRHEGAVETTHEKDPSYDVTGLPTFEPLFELDSEDDFAALTSPVLTTQYSTSILPSSNALPHSSPTAASALAPDTPRAALSTARGHYPDVTPFTRY